jgi:4-hydroxy-tetrahydrodipicolinate reductase
MGTRILSLIKRDEEVKLLAGIDVGQDLRDFVKEADVIVDFSAPSSSARCAAIAAENRKAMVIGTTGLSTAEADEVKKASGAVPIVYSPNMSIGVNLMLRLIEISAGTIGSDHDIDIHETHHAAKKDRPSGTAKLMASTIAHALEEDRKVVNIDGEPIERADSGSDIRVFSSRIGDVVGDHEIEFSDEGESLKIIHHARNRDIFAKGAMRAIKWVVGRRPGLYTMADVLFGKTIG